MAVEYSANVPEGVEAPRSAVSWAAIIAGAIAAAAMALILISLGSGLGLLAVSPWHNDNTSKTVLGIGTIVWSIITEIIAFGLGGYLAGRLRTKWVSIHGDEAYFRDTAHGFMTWALGTLIAVCIGLSVLGSVSRGVAQMGAAAAGGMGGGMMAMHSGGQGGQATGQSSSTGTPIDYFADMLMRPVKAPAGAQPPAGGAAQPSGADLNQSREEIARILLKSFSAGSLSPDDRTYVAQIVSARTGLSEADAEKRVDDVMTQAKTAYEEATQKVKEAADTARKVSAALAFWSFIAMLIGAFSSSYAATIGGRRRDR